MRERLIELLSEAFHEEASTFMTERIADYLLANGVIVPPCKVGQTLYDITEFLDGTRNPIIYELKCNSIAYIKCNGSGYWEYDCTTLRESDFGKTVFLTHEEAEAALKARADDAAD